MKITDKRRHRTTKFSELNLADVFTLEEYDGTWIKGDVDSEDDHISTCLEDGSIAFFGNSDVVTRLNVELVISD